MTSSVSTRTPILQAGATSASGLQPITSDPELPALRHIYDADWVWERFCSEFGVPDETPDQLKLQHCSYHPGRRAVITYVAERQWDDWVTEDQFTFELRAGRDDQLFRYPHDPHLPGLEHVASATVAHEVLPRHVSLHPQRLHVEMVRYRPTRKAVLRHIVRFRRPHVDDVTLYVRVVPPDEMPGLLAAGELAERSAFVLPRLVGCWPESGVAWLANVPGETVGALIREGAPPEPEQVFDAIEPLWSATDHGNAGSPLDLLAHFEWTERLLAGLLRDSGKEDALLPVISELRPFVEAWRPTSLAHNDFYGDQLILAPSGRLALVDFEEVGPGEPLIDAGNMLAHLRWKSHESRVSGRYDAYRERFRSTALDRFGWDERDLALREAYAIFRLTANANWDLGGDLTSTIESGLALATEVLSGAE